MNKERMKAAVASFSVAKSIVVPPILMPGLTLLVHEYASQHREEVDACYRAVEVAVIQRGLRALRKELEANRKLTLVMGWKKEEGDGS